MKVPSALVSAMFVTMSILPSLHAFLVKSNLVPIRNVRKVMTMDLKVEKVEGSEVMSPKLVTKDIMAFFAQPTGSVSSDALKNFGNRLLAKGTMEYIDGLHILTIIFQSARSKRKVDSILPNTFLLEKLQAWDREWSERDISTFVYGVQALDCYEPAVGDLLLFAAKKISESTVRLTSRAIGNALYGLNLITSDLPGIPELCEALAKKIDSSSGDLNGQDIGIGLYGLQGLSAGVPQVRTLVKALANKISISETELDAQALSNALYGLQVYHGDYTLFFSHQGLLIKD